MEELFLRLLELKPSDEELVRFVTVDVNSPIFTELV